MNLKDITVYSKRPRYMQNTVFHSSPLWIEPEQHGLVVLGVLAKTSEIDEFDVEVDVR